MPSFDTTPDNYKVKLFEQIEDFDPDQYGNIWYNVLFEGDAETFMWLKKDPPEEGKEYYGHVEPTKSGKRLRFKTDKLPEGVKPTSSTSSGVKDKPFMKDVTDMPDRWMGRLLPYFDAQNLVKDGKITEHGRHFIESAITLAEESLNLVDKIRNAETLVRSTDAHHLSAIKEELTPSIGTPPASDTSLGDKFRNRKLTTEYDESDMPDEG